jgi:hypothetical protein
MDRHIKDNLEEYMRGAMEPGTRAEFENRLNASDGETRETVAQFQHQSELIRDAFRAPADISPAPGFYGRVMDRIHLQRPLSIWAAFIEPMFFRRIALASAALLILLSLTMFTTTPENGDEMLASNPALVMDAMADQEPAPVMGENPEEDRDAILVNLATYQETQSF